MTLALSQAPVLRDAARTEASGQGWVCTHSVLCYQQCDGDLPAVCLTELQADVWGCKQTSTETCYLQDWSHREVDAWEDAGVLV